MKKISKTETFKKNVTAISTEKGRQEKALKLHNRLLDIKKSAVRTAYEFYMTMLVVEKEETWREMDAPSFDAYVCLPEIDCGVDPETVKKYIRIYKRCFDAGLEASEIEGVPINKLALVIGTSRPMSWLSEAKILGINDLKARIAVEEEGKTEEEAEPRQKKSHNVICPSCGAVINL